MELKVEDMTVLLDGFRSRNCRETFGKILHSSLVEELQARIDRCEDGDNGAVGEGKMHLGSCVPSIMLYTGKDGVCYSSRAGCLGLD